MMEKRKNEVIDENVLLRHWIDLVEILRKKAGRHYLFERERHHV